MSNKTSLSKASLTSLFIFLLSFPWYIGFYLSLQNMDTTECDNSMYITGTQAMWFYFSLSAYSLLLFPMNLRIYHVQEHERRQSCLINVKFITDLFAIFLSVGVVLNMGLELVEGHQCPGFQMIFSGHIMYYVTIWMMIILINVGSMYNQNCLRKCFQRRAVNQEEALLVV